MVFWMVDQVQHSDQKTLDYFDNFTPSYRPERFNFAIEFINEQKLPGAKLLDIGCGDGATLNLLRNKTGLSDLTGLDISPSYLDRARKATGCNTIEGSILDSKLVAQHEGQFDYCTLGAVIHHLIGATRKESMELGRLSVANSMRLLKNGGHLLVFEPTYSPEWAMKVVFNIKKAVTRWTSSRIELFRSWANFGEPVVSYYTPERLDSFIADARPNHVTFREELDHVRFGGILKRCGMGVIVRKG
jgi:SAM-dependent methyltransferase